MTARDQLLHCLTRYFEAERQAALSQHYDQCGPLDGYLTWYGARRAMDIALLDAKRILGEA